MERTAERLRALLEINNAIITNLSEEALLRTIAEALRRVVPFDRAALTLTWLRRMRFGSRLSREALSPTIFGRGWRSGRQKTVWGGCSITSSPLFAAILKQSSSMTLSAASPPRARALTA